MYSSYKKLQGESPCRITVVQGNNKMATIIKEVDIPLMLDSEVVATFISFDELKDPVEHIAIRLGGFKAGGHKLPLVRLHSECLTGDIFHSMKCDCGDQLSESLRLINEVGGYLIYLRQEGRGIGLYKKLEAYALQQHSGVDTYEANNMLGFADDLRDYFDAAQMLKALGCPKITLLTSNPEKELQLRNLGIEITEVKSTSMHIGKHNAGYIKAKIEVTHHQFTAQAEVSQ
ncbi:GTP cyclohydrolase II RibA [Pseudomonas gessardii]|nr:GTP cyclohydrolase II RibA [Pseudomonas gessardii]